MIGIICGSGILLVALVVAMSLGLSGQGGAALPSSDGFASPGDGSKGFAFTGELVSANALNDDEAVVVVGGTIARVNFVTGKRVWERDNGGWAASVTVRDGLILETKDGGIRTRSSETGEVISEGKAEGYAVNCSNEAIVVLSDTGTATYDPNDLSKPLYTSSVVADIDITPMCWRSGDHYRIGFDYLTYFMWLSASADGGQLMHGVSTLDHFVTIFEEAVWVMESDRGDVIVPVRGAGAGTVYQDRYLLLGTQGNGIAAIDMQAGELIWEGKGKPGDGRNDVVSLGEQVFGLSETQVFAIAPETGETRDLMAMPSSGFVIFDHRQNICGADGRRTGEYELTTVQPTTFRCMAADGSQAWSYELPSGAKVLGVDIVAIEHQGKTVVFR